MNRHCPNCGQPLQASDDQNPCPYQGLPDHGDQTWWECPDGHAWEDEEL